MYTLPNYVLSEPANLVRPGRKSGAGAIQLPQVTATAL